MSAENLEVMSASLRVFSIENVTIVKGKCTKPFKELRFLQENSVPNIPFDISKLKNLTFMDDRSKGNVQM